MNTAQKMDLLLVACELARENAGLPENMLAYNYGKSFRTLYETL